MKKAWKALQRGNVGDLMLTGVCMLAMTVMMLAYMNSLELLEQKREVGQLARKYILQMETTGYLTAENSEALKTELAAVGATEISLNGTTVNPVGYGENIILQMEGRLGGEYAFSEKRTSTAKN